MPCDIDAVPRRADHLIKTTSLAEIRRLERLRAFAPTIFKIAAASPNSAYISRAESGGIDPHPTFAGPSH